MIPEISAKGLEANFSKLSSYMVFMLPVPLFVFSLPINSVASGVVGLFINLPNLRVLLRRARFLKEHLQSLK